ncbi:kinase-like protein [Ramaria rubella]|nr:kinase-like protein [Ramaria rubella]
MAGNASRRPLPSPPTDLPHQACQDPGPMAAELDAELYAASPSYFASLFPNPWAANQPASGYQNPAAFSGGTLLHKGFYDLLSIIPSAPSPSRLWRAAAAGLPASNPHTDVLLAGPRYDHIAPGNPPTVLSGTPQLPQQHHHSPPFSSPPISPNPATPLRKARRISKDMVSRPTGFVHLVHASDADQAEALLRRWGPDGIGKLGDPRWADPIKNVVRQQARARGVAQVVTALKPSPESRLEDAPLRVVNGMSTISTTTVANSTVATLNHSPVQVTGVDGLPSIVPGPRGSTIRWGGGLVAHAEHEDEDAPSRTPIPSSSPTPHPPIPSRDLPPLPTAPDPPPRIITPSLTTLEKAISARIYFENLYFPLLRHPPSRDQRRLAMEREMEEMHFSQAQKAELRERWRQNETAYLRDRRRKVDPSAFVKLKTIGHGAFGVVSLVREVGTGQLYAMKQLRKTDMLRKGQEGHVRAERDVLKSAALIGTSAGADWIVKMFYSFQDRDHLYLVLEFMGGGDLLNLLIERDVFEEDFARFYIAEMILAIEQCHKQGFIHRDIKPDNFLFDPDGHIKLSDFGLATDLHWAHDTSYYEQQRKDLLHKHGIDLEDGNSYGGDGTKTRRMNKKEVEQIMGGGEGEGGVFTWREKNRKKLAYSVCGTNSYSGLIGLIFILSYMSAHHDHVVSPEVIRGHGYTFSCDWWSLGVIMFECLYGYPPFVSNSRHVTRQKILNWKQSLRFPARPRVSHSGVNLMEQLLCEPEDRLGAQSAASVSRPDSLVVQARRSAFVNPYSGKGSVDGAELIKAHPWFRGIDWVNIRKYPAPFRPELQNPEDTRHFDGDIPAEPLAPANGAPADATRDPMLRDKVHGADILEVRKALAFAGFTHKSPRAISYTRVPVGEIYPVGEVDSRGRNTIRETGRGTPRRGRAISM